MDGIIPARDRGKSALRYTWNEDGAVTNIEPLERIRNNTRFLHSSSSHDKDGRSRVPWPFHHRGASEVPSTPATSHFSHFRKATAQTKTFLRSAEDSASTFSRSLVPDYVVNYIRGETPETLARKREQQRWKEKCVEVTPQRERFRSHIAQFDNPWGSSTHLNPNGYANEDRQQGIRRLLTGWRGGVMLNTLLVLLILLIIVVCLIIILARSQISSGDSVIFSGSCATTSRTSTGLHVLINIFTLTVLAGANYVFQVLSSPTRAELAAAHSKKHWLDIGIPSMRNLLHISGVRITFIAILLLSAVATQVIFNSVIFTPQSGLDYDVVFITQPFLDGAPFSNATENNGGHLSRSKLLSLQADAMQMKLVNLTTDACLQEFGGSFEPTYDAVLLVVSQTVTTSALVQTETAGTSLKADATLATRDGVSLDRSLVQYCLAREGLPQTCNVTVSSPLLGIVALLTLAGLISTAVVLARSKFEPLATLGDAIRSFLRHPDSTTAGACFLTKKDVKHGRWGYGEAKYFIPYEHYWFKTPSFARWALFAGSWLAIGAPTAIAVVMVISVDPQGLSTPFGTATPYTSFLLPSPISKSQMSLLASVPQLFLAILYLVTNSHLTSYYFSHELTLFALGPRPLRVSSDPVGAQTTSLYLTLPRPVSWLLFTLFAAAGFVLSQAVFPAVIVLSGSVSTLPDNEAGSVDPLVALAFSTRALLVLLALLSVLLLAVLGLGLRRAAPASLGASGSRKGNPLALRGGSCSAALSARCHPPPPAAAGGAGEVEPWRCELAWGVVAEGTGMQEGRCGFSATGVGAVDTGRSYA